MLLIQIESKDLSMVQETEQIMKLKYVLKLTVLSAEL